MEYKPLTPQYDADLMAFKNAYGIDEIKTEY